MIVMLKLTGMLTSEINMAPAPSATEARAAKRALRHAKNVKLEPGPAS